jgi:hypothetical protein
MTHSMHGGGHEVKNKMLSTEVSGFLFISVCRGCAEKNLSNCKSMCLYFLTVFNFMLIFYITVLKNTKFQARNMSSFGVLGWELDRSVLAP